MKSFMVHRWATTQRLGITVLNNFFSLFLSYFLLLLRRYHCQASDLADGHVEPPQVQWLLAHSGQLGHRRAPLLHEVQVPLHPAPPFGLHTHLVEANDSVSAQ